MGHVFINPFKVLWTNQTQQVVSGSSDFDPGTTVDVLEGVGPILASVLISAFGQWSATITLPHEGLNGIRAGVIFGDNTALSSYDFIQLDTVVPSLTIAPSGAIVGQTSTLSGTANVGDASTPVSLYDGATLLTTVDPASDGTWSAVVSLTTTTFHTITARATDQAGNQGSSASVFKLFTSGSCTPGLLLHGRAVSHGSRGPGIVADALHGRDRRQRGGRRASVRKPGVSRGDRIEIVLVTRPWHSIIEEARAAEGSFDPQNTVTFDGVDIATLVANPGDFRFV